MALVDSSHELGISLTPGVEPKQPTAEDFATEIYKSYLHWKRHYAGEAKDIRNRGGLGERPKGFFGSKGLEQALHPGSLNKIGIPKEVTPTTGRALSIFVDKIFEKAPQAVKTWFRKHPETDELSGDPRLIFVSRLIQKKLTSEG